MVVVVAVVVGGGGGGVLILRGNKNRSYIFCGENKCPLFDVDICTLFDIKCPLYVYIVPVHFFLPGFNLVIVLTIQPHPSPTHSVSPNTDLFFSSSLKKPNLVCTWENGNG